MPIFDANWLDFSRDDDDDYEPVAGYGSDDHLYRSDGSRQTDTYVQENTQDGSARIGSRSEFDQSVGDNQKKGDSGGEWWRSITDPLGLTESEAEKRERLRAEATLNEFLEGGPLGVVEESLAKPDQGYVDAQRTALNQMQAVAAKNGLTSADRARIADINREMATADRGQREAIDQTMQARGMSGGGQELQAQLMGRQASQSQAQSSANAAARAAEARALQAMQSSGDMASRGRQQSFGEGVAADQFNRQNAEARERYATDRAAMATGQYSTNQARRDQQAQQNRETTQGVVETIASIWS